MGRSRPHRVRPSRLHALLVVLLLSACDGTLARIPGIALLPVPLRTAPGITEDELRGELLAFTTRFSVIVIAAADEIAASTNAPAIRRRTVLWKLRMIPLAHQALLTLDPQEAYFELLTLTQAMAQYLTDGAGRELFGDAQPIAVDAARDVEVDLQRIGARFLSPEPLADATARAAELARQHPIRGVFLRAEIEVGLAQVAPGSRFSDLIDLPMAPFRALQGVDAGAQAIREFNATAQQFNALVAGLPQQLLWQLELFLYDVEETHAVGAGLEAFESIAQSAARLPHEIRLEGEALIERLAASEAELGDALAAYRAALADTGPALVSARELAQTLGTAAERVDAAGVTWAALIRDLRAPPADASTAGGAEGQSFDLLELERAAARVEQTGSELRAHVADLRALDDEGIGLLDRIFWRALLFVALSLGLLLVYRAAGARITRGGGPRRESS